VASQHASGTTSALSIGSETFLGTDPDTTTGAFQFLVELSTLARGDVLEVRLYEKPNDTGDTARQIKKWVFANEQDDLAWISDALLLVIGWRFSLKQTAGTGRTFQWSIRKA
jgi:hypothetical protein